MSNPVTNKFRVFNAKQLVESFSEAAADVLYVFLGRPGGWPVDTAPPAPTSDVDSVDFDFWRSMLAARRVTSSDVSHVVPRYNWTTGKVYRQYKTNDASLYDVPASSNTFYVVTTDYNVYKCLFNNKGAASANKPTGTSTTTVIADDGYHWKFLYTIDAGEALKFLTNTHMPVKTLTEDDGSAQWDVQDAAASGPINIIDVTAGGSAYAAHKGTLAAVASATSMTLAAGASAIDNIYNTSSIYITTGLGAGGYKKIVDYNGTTKVVTLLAPGLGTVPDGTSVYYIAPTVEIAGDGTLATAWANVVGNDTGAINYVNMITLGSGYSTANVTFVANTSHGSGATATPQISPYLGHGGDPVQELVGKSVLLNARFEGVESGSVAVTNDFRSIGLMEGPLLANSSPATSSLYDQTIQLTLGSVTNAGRFTNDEIVRNASGSANAVVVSFANTNAANTAGILHVVDRDGTLTAADILTGGTSGSTGVISTIATRPLLPFSGTLLYIDHRSPVSRNADQTEDIKLVIQF